jgi:hypothetical protein
MIENLFSINYLGNKPNHAIPWIAGLPGSADAVVGHEGTYEFT